MNMKIKILGNGGCLNNGLPHHSFIIDDSFLLEAPPDIMNSLNSFKIGIESIDTIFISHLHGDHTFGIPFIIINQWFKSVQNNVDCSFTLIGPKGIKKHVLAITEHAFDRSHPCVKWLEDNVIFSTIDSDAEISVNEKAISFFDLIHIENTYGLLYRDNGEALFAYIADTIWCQQVENVLKLTPRTVLMDMNGGGMHISLGDVIEKGLPITGECSAIYGSHLSDEFESPNEFIKCAKPGEEILIEGF